MRIYLYLAVALAAFVAAGCGGEQSTDSPSQTATPVDLILGDCSSFRSHSQAYVDQMVAVTIQTAAEPGIHRLWAGCMDGAPLRTLDWTIKQSFGQPLPHVDERTRASVDRARAIGLRPRFVALLREPPEVYGSGQLEALEVVSQTPRVRHVWMFTDGIVHQAGGVDLKRATSVELERTAARWAARLEGKLAGIDVTFVGIGRGTPSSLAVRNARTLFESVVEDAGGKFGWVAALPTSPDES